MAPVEKSAVFVAKNVGRKNESVTDPGLLVGIRSGGGDNQAPGGAGVRCRMTNSISLPLSQEFHSMLRVRNLQVMPGRYLSGSIF